MAEITIQYQIEASDYAEANALVIGKGKGYWVETGLFLGSSLLLAVLPLTYKQADTEWQYPYLVVPFVCFQLYFALLYLVPRLNANRAYRYTSLAGKSFVATLSETGLRYETPGVTWENQWSALQLVKETDRIFLLFDGYTMFILGKRYFTPENLAAVRELIREQWQPESPK
jgi:hypothetical protein